MTTNRAFQFERHERILIVVPSRELMQFRDSDIRDAYNDAYRLIDSSDYDHLLIDFSELDHFGSTFVGILIRLAKKVRLNGGEAALCNLNDNLREMLKTLMLLENTKTDFFWTPFESREAAVQILLKPTSE
ncbi:MAG: STAS domain-containing protein [Planctomycetaceae bacterium]